MSELKIIKVDKENLKTIVEGKVPIELTKTLDMYYELNNQGISTNEIGYALANIAYRFLNPFSKEYGLEIKKGDIHFYNIPKEEMPHAFMYFKDRKIKELDGYKIEGDLKFSKNNIEMGTYLRGQGWWATRILEQLAGIENKEGDGIKKPIISKKENDIHIAGIHWINPILDRISLAYESIGKERLEELSKLNQSIINQTDENKAKKFLQQQYDEAIHWGSLKDKF